MDLTRLSTQQRVSLGAIVVVMVSAFLPWVSLFGFSVSGIEGDGVITLVLGVAGAVVLLVSSGAVGSGDRSAGKVAEIALVVLAALVALIGIIDMNGAAAIGLYLTWLAGMTWMGAAIWQLVSSNTAKATA